MILVVEANREAALALSGALQLRGYPAQAVTTADELFSTVDDKRVDLILLDSTDDDHRVLDILKQIRRTYPLTALPILIVAGSEDPKLVIQSLSAGANDCLNKPLEFDILVARIETQLRLKNPNVEVTTGEFRRRRRLRSGAKRASIYCSRCLTCQPESGPKCIECGWPRPTSSWPEIATSPYVHLGQTIGGRYFLERFVGRGTTGSVYRARDTDLRRTFAAKVMDLGDGTNEKIRSRLEAEVDAMAALNNPHVVKIYEVSHVSGNVYALIMDFVTGHTLGEVLDSIGNLEPWLALDVLRQAAQGLHEAHQHGLVHRDVKPDNLMLEKLPAGGYHTRVLDFGIVTDLGAYSDSGFVGTPLFMAPEQIAETGPLDHRADIYSLGAVVFSMLTGAPPYDAESVVAILKQHQTAPIPSLANLVDAEPEEIEALDQLIGWMMAKQPEDRPSSLTEVIRRIDRIRPRLKRTGGQLPSVSRAVRQAMEESAASRQEAPKKRRTLVDTGTPGVKPLFGKVRWERDASVFMALSSDYQVLAVRTSERGCRLYHLNFPTRRARKLELANFGRRTMSALSDTGRFGAVYNNETGVGAVVDMTTASPPRPFALTSRNVTALAVSGDGVAVVAGSQDGRLLYNEGGGQREYELGSTGDAVTCLAFTARRLELGVGRADGTLSVIPLGPRGQRCTLPPLPFAPTRVCFNGVGDLGAVLGDEKRISLFLPMGGVIVNQHEFEFESVLNIAFNQRGRLVCLQARDQQVQIWDIQKLFDSGAGRTTIIRGREDAKRLRKQLRQ